MEFAESVCVRDIEFHTKSTSTISQEERQSKGFLFEDQVVETVCLLYSLTHTASGPYGDGLIKNLVWGREGSNSPREDESVEDLQN